MTTEFIWSEFDAAAVETPSREPLPPGEYTAILTESGMKPNKAGTGEYLALTYQVVGGDHDGRFVWDNLNLVHANEKAVQIAKAALASLCKAVGVLQPRESADLHGIPLAIRVAVENDREGNPRNVVKGCKPAAAAGALPPKPPAGKPVAAAAPGAPGPKPAPSTPPWKKKA